MSCREERILAKIVARLQTVTSLDRVELQPPDEHGDRGPFPNAAVLPGDVLPVGDFNRHHGRVAMPVTVRVLSQDEATSGNDGLPLTSRSACYALMALVMPALFPPTAARAYQDDLDGEATSFTYSSHSIEPRDDGGKTFALFIDCSAEWVLHLNDPNK